VAIVDPKAKEKEEKVLRREEKLKEMDRRKKVPYGRGKKALKYNLRNQAMYGLNGLNPADNNDGGDDGKENYDKINGEKVLREYGPEG